uniref:Putative e3 ubiquitin ligase n=1 Tax=Culex tarsalis TaxID=7177 RepID=A0A1Q3F942_CULTA
MMALAEIAEFIVNVFQLVNYLLKISIFIGKVLVEIIRNCSLLAWKVLQAIGRFMVVFYEDYAYFIEDFRCALNSIAAFVIECLSAICGGLVRAVLAIGDGIAVGYHGVGELLSGRLLTVPIFTVEFVKQVLVLLGNGVWFLVTLPGQLAQGFWECFSTGLKVLEGFSRDVGAKSLEIVCRLAVFLVKDVPLQSVGGLFVLALAYMYPKCTKSVLNFCFRVVRYFYRKLLPYGRGIRRKFLEARSKISQLLTRTLGTALICFVFIRDRAVHIYDTELRQALVLIRDFFTFTERQPALRPQPHLARIQQRDSSTSSSSRSSSTGSERSVAVRRSSPAKQDGTSGGLLASIGLCIICEDNEKSVVLVPCGHLCLCKRCANQLSHYDQYCPLCRMLIHRKVEVFV